MKVLSERLRTIIIYAAKCASGSLAVFIIASLIHYTDIGWALISVILVLSPDARDSVSLAVTRIKANIVGASVGVLFLLISQPNMWMVSAALVITLCLCYLFRLETGIRSSLAATVIIMLHEVGKHLWDTAIERVIAVLAGCGLGLLITFIFHFKFTRSISGIKPHQEA